MTGDKIYIAGAHSRGRTLKVYLEYLYPNLNVVSFLVDDMSENPEQVDGVPVSLIRKGLCTDYPVYIGMRGINHPKVTEELRAVGMKEIIPVTVELDRMLRNEYVRKYYGSLGRTFQLIDEIPSGKGEIENCRQQKSGKIYVASSVSDQKLQTAYTMSEDEVILQVGAALTDQRLGGLTDCEGENISCKNKQYCELTGLYWIWKHAREDYIGLVHYRRHFLLPGNWVERMEADQIDVILPVPLYVAPSIARNYMERHDAADWLFLMEYLKAECPEEYEDAVRVFEGSLYSPCNMLIARREVLAALCNWLFPILDAVTSHGGVKADNYLNRYPGFISERLITYFFEKHKNEYKIVYADKNFLQ